VKADLLAAALTLHAAVNARLLRAPVPATRPTTVIIPARDEAPRVGGCVRSVLAAGATDVVVVDDGSRDGTAAQVPVDRRVRVLTGSEPPPGWLGKPWACAQGAAVATGEVLVFLDADVVLHVLPGLPDGLALVSPYPRLVATSPLARLVQPLLRWSWLTFLPLRLAETSPRPSLSAAGGQLLVVDAAAYRAVGGHAAVRSAVVEDLELLKALKRRGFRGVVVEGREVATATMYDTDRALVDGWTKSLPAALGPVGSVTVPAVLTAAYVLPWLRRSPVGIAAGIAGRLVSDRSAAAVTQPLSVLAFDVLVAVSWWRRLRGTTRWKGRPV
jgi:hypothetical protein